MGDNLPEDFSELNECLETEIWVDERKEVQFRFSISEFREKHYIGIRKWLLDYDGEWIPTKAGVTMPYDLATTSALFSAFCKILSKAEVLHEVVAHSKEDTPAEAFVEDGE